MVNPITIFHRRPRDLEHVHAEAIASDEGRFPAQLPRLLHHQGHFLVKVRHDECLGAALLGVGQLGAEIHVPAAESLVGDDLAAETGIGLDEVFRQPFGVVAADVVDDGRFLDLQLIEEVLGDDLALVGIREANPEGVQTVDKGPFGGLFSWKTLVETGSCGKGKSAKVLWDET